MNRAVSPSRFAWLGLLLPALAAGADAEGVALFESACAACHGSDGRGRTASELGFDVPVPDFTDCDFAAREPDADWMAIVHEGGPVRGFDPMMPAFGAALSDEEMRQILARVRAFCTNDDWPRGELNLPRALYTEKAFPEDEAVIEGTLVSEGNDAWTSTFLWEQRFGTRNQMEVSIPVSRADLGTAGWQTGAGDLAIGVKHVLRHSSRKGTILSVGGEVVLATGREGFSGDTTVYETYLAYGKVLPRDAFLQLQGIVEMPTDSAGENEALVRAAVGRTWTAGGPYGRAWTPMVELLASRDLESGAETQWFVVPQVQVSLNRRQHLLASAGLRIPANNASAQQTELAFYLLWDWFDGGVREGW